jgi:hypothetical protein
MTEKAEDSLYVRVKDYAGNEFLCPVNALKNPKDVSEEELENCVDDATVGRYIGNIDIVK